MAFDARDRAASGFRLLTAGWEATAGTNPAVKAPGERPAAPSDGS